MRAHGARSLRRIAVGPQRRVGHDRAGGVVAIGPAGRRIGAVRRRQQPVERVVDVILSRVFLRRTGSHFARKRYGRSNCRPRARRPGSGCGRQRDRLTYEDHNRPKMASFSVRIYRLSLVTQIDLSTNILSFRSGRRRQYLHVKPT